MALKGRMGISFDHYQMPSISSETNKSALGILLTVTARDLVRHHYILSLKTVDSKENATTQLLVENVLRNYSLYDSVKSGSICVTTDAAERGTARNISPLSAICVVHSLSRVLKRTLDDNLEKICITAATHWCDLNHFIQAADKTLTKSELRQRPKGCAKSLNSYIENETPTDTDKKKIARMKIMDRTLILEQTLGTANLDKEISKQIDQKIKRVKDYPRIKVLYFNISIL